MSKTTYYNHMAFPIAGWKNDENIDGREVGMNMRQYYAGLSMAARRTDSQTMSSKDIARLAVQDADALMLELEKSD